MIGLPHDASNSPSLGTWCIVRCVHGDEIGIRCPECGACGGLDNHEIDDFGRVTPVLGCAADCGFQGYVVLFDWEKNKP